LHFKTSHVTLKNISLNLETVTWSFTL